MIKRLFVDNYKCLVNFELPLEELSLLLGPSGVGKTSVLDIIYSLRQLLSGDARVTDRDIFPTSTLTRWQSRDLQVFAIDVLLQRRPTPTGSRWSMSESSAWPASAAKRWRLMEPVCSSSC